MKSQLVYKRLTNCFLVVAGAIIFNSCAVYNTANQSALPVSDIVKMSRDGAYSKDIIRQIKRSHSVYKLPASELAKLRDEGVQDSVINYMERTNMESILRNERYQDSWYGYPGYGYPYYGFGYPYYGFGLGFGWPYWNWGYGSTVIIRHSGENHGDSRSRR